MPERPRRQEPESLATRAGHDPRHVPARAASERRAAGKGQRWLGFARAAAGAGGRAGARPLKAQRARFDARLDDWKGRLPAGAAFGELSTAIVEVERVTRSNAEVSDASNRTAAQLAEQAHQLENLVGSFHMRAAGDAVTEPEAARRSRSGRWPGPDGMAGVDQGMRSSRGWNCLMVGVSLNR